MWFDDVSDRNGVPRFGSVGLRPGDDRARLQQFANDDRSEHACVSVAKHQPLSRQRSGKTGAWHCRNFAARCDQSWIENESWTFALQPGCASRARRTLEEIKRAV